MPAASVPLASGRCRWTDGTTGRSGSTSRMRWSSTRPACPHELVERRWRTVEDAVEGIASMQVRGAPLIGVAAAHGLALAMRADPSDGALVRAAAALLGS